MAKSSVRSVISHVRKNTTKYCSQKMKIYYLSRKVTVIDLGMFESYCQNLRMKSIKLPRTPVPTYTCIFKTPTRQIQYIFALQTSPQYTYSESEVEFLESEKGTMAGSICSPVSNEPFDQLSSLDQDQEQVNTQAH